MERLDLSTRTSRIALCPGPRPWGFADSFADFVGLLGVSNHGVAGRAARALAAAAGLPGYEVLQYHHSTCGAPGPPSLSSLTAGPERRPELLSYLGASGLTLVAYSPLLGGAYGRRDKPMGPDYDHPGTPRGSPRCGRWRLRRGPPPIRSCSPG